MNERRRKAFDFASDTSKQLITLATGIIAITITFAKDLLEIGEATALLVWAWVVYLFSILSGVWTLMALTGELERREEGKEEPSIRGGNVTLPATLQILSFCAGTLLIVIFGGISV
jgi:hypothetical protein